MMHVDFYAPEFNMFAYCNQFLMYTLIDRSIRRRSINEKTWNDVDEEEENNHQSMKVKREKNMFFA